MTTGELIEKLRKKSLPATERRLQYAVAKGKLRTPRKDGAGNFAFDESDIVAAAEYFNQPQTVGKPRASESV